MRLYVISALVIAFLAILFALQNTNLVTIQLFLWEYRQSLALILLGTLAIGVIIGLLVSVPALIRRNLKTARVQKQADSLTDTIHAKEQAIATATQTTYTTQQNYEELLQSLGVLDPVTGLIRQDLMPPTVSALLTLFPKLEELAQPPAPSALLFKVLPVLEDGFPPDSIFASVGELLRPTPSFQYWFYSAGRRPLSASLTGLHT